MQPPGRKGQSATPNARAILPDLTYAGDAVAAAKDADAVLLATEWPQFANSDRDEVCDVVAARVLVAAAPPYRWNGGSPQAGPYTASDTANPWPAGLRAARAARSPKAALGTPGQ